MERQLQVSLETAPLVILEGARATGKTRLVNHSIENGWLAEARSFLDPVELNAASTAPRDYVFGLPHGTAIDEAQLCEAILLPVKERVEEGEPGALLLTGSTRLRRDQLGGGDPLAGRVGTPLHLGPLTVGERSGAPTQLVDQLFNDDPGSIELGASIARNDLIGLVQQPGLPGLLADEPVVRSDRARAYIAQATTQSSFASVDIQRVGQLARYLAGRTSTAVNINQFANDVELARPTVEKYLAHLEEALLLVRLPGWRRSKDKSETDRAKVHFFDAGIACASARMRPAGQDDDFGRLAETLLVTDLVRQSRWLPEPPDCYHWRRSDRDEVDLILESADGRAICVEVKVAESVSGKDFRGIDAFRERHPDSFHRGFVFYSGSNVQPFGENRWAIPYASLRSSKEAADSSSIEQVIDELRSKRRALAGGEDDHRMNPYRREAKKQLTFLGASLHGYDAEVRTIDNQILLMIRATNRQLRSSFGNLLGNTMDPLQLVTIETHASARSMSAAVGSRLGSIERSPVTVSLDEGSAAELVTTLLGAVVDDLAQELSRLDNELL